MRPAGFWCTFRASSATERERSCARASSAENRSHRDTSDRVGWKCRSGVPRSCALRCANATANSLGMPMAVGGPLGHSGRAIAGASTRLEAHDGVVVAGQQLHREGAEFVRDLRRLKAKRALTKPGGCRAVPPSTAVRCSPHCRTPALPPRRPPTLKVPTDNAEGY